ncbi:recombinase family protein [Vagococcus sp. DIV0080]|uniref:Recombinase family protein n=1 Tax=Candidatus Vagococcus giribetii TaxID=2230876 RepID=A0ABS3HWB7_9ENTE|nr:recombinase family protein [Vagococcus sp. DIV0080]MBO0477971.1 recombinase family protein [Vagococcus sp. DIV0080]
MAKIGYIRVSTFDQNLDSQIERMNENKVEVIFEEKISGKDTNRPEFQKMLDFVRPGDEIYVTSLDRLGRNYDDIKDTVTYFKSKKVKISILDAEFLNFNTENDLLDTAMFDMFLSLLSYIAENEREKIKERQKQGVKIAKEAGRYKGRPTEYSKDGKNPQSRLVYQSIVEKLKQRVPIIEISKDTGVSRPTIYKIKSELND